MRSPTHPAWRPQADDTAPDIDKRLIAAYRAMSPGEKLRRVGEDSRAVEMLALAGVAVRHPSSSPEARLLALAARRLDATLLSLAYPPGGIARRRPVVAIPSDPVALAVHVAAILEGLGIQSVVGGSIASSVFGEPRATEDIDVVADLHEKDVDPLLAALASDFYVDETAVGRAIGSRSSFNVIHLASARKIDIFVPAENALARSQLLRRTLVTLSDDPPARLYLLAAEDVVLQKLLWYRKAGEVSDRQWRDVLGVLKVQADALDKDYLRDMAAGAGLLDLLERAQSETEAR